MYLSKVRLVYKLYRLKFPKVYSGYFQHKKNSNLFETFDDYILKVQYAFQMNFTNFHVSTYFFQALQFLKYFCLFSCWQSWNFLVSGYRIKLSLCSIGQNVFFKSVLRLQIFYPLPFLSKFSEFLTSCSQGMTWSPSC